MKRLRKFVTATAAPPLLNTHAAALARLSLGYAAGYVERCEGLNNGTTLPLRSFAAEAASLTSMTATAKS